MADHLIVYCTCPADAAPRLAAALVESGLAACVNQLPGVESTYRWHGQICSDRETLLLIKTTAGAFESLRQTLLAQHPYELPEIVAVPVGAGHPPYLQWISDCVSPATPASD